MDLKELVEGVSGSTGTPPEAVRKVLDATFAAVTKQMAADEPLKLEGFGTFVRKGVKEEGKARIVFRPWLTKEQRQEQKGKHAAKKADG
jgi:nucleoid DNA-binding protein